MLTMLRSFTVYGIWYRSGSSGKAYQGTLRYRPGKGLRLRIEGDALTSEGLATAHNPNVLYLLGKNHAGEPLTLRDGFYAGSRGDGKGFAQTEFLFHHLFVGRHFSDDAEICLSGFEVSFNQLFEWLGREAARSNMSNTECFTYNFERPSREVLFSDSEMDISSRYSWRLRSHYLCKRVGIEADAWLRTQFRKSVGLTKVFAVAAQLQELLALVRNCRVLPSKVRLFLHCGDTRPEEEPPSCEFFFTPIGSGEGSTAPPAWGCNLTMLNLRAELGEDTSQILGRWFTTSERNALMYSLYFGDRYHGSGPWENRFLNLVEALEAFHRLNFSNDQLPPDEHSSRVGLILNTCPAEYRQWLAEKLRYSNEPSLRSRLNDILRKYHAYVMGLVPSEKWFINELVTARNSFSHGLASAHKVEAVAILRLNARLSALIEAIAFKELGFREETVLRIIQSRWSAEISHLNSLRE